jgi:hypothetical protein
VPLRGKYHALITENVADPARALLAIAHLFHEQSFDPVPLEELGIGSTDHEARWSESCELCGAIWIGTKAGEILCIHLCEDPPRVWKLTLERGIRTLLHLHRPNAFGPDKTLLVGTDDGFLHRIHEVSGEPVLAKASLHVESWWGAGAAAEAVTQGATEASPRVLRATESVARTRGDRYALGITAMAPLRGHERGASPILIATRRGAIFLLGAEPGPSGEPAKLRLRLLHLMSGWVQWILEPPDRTHITCISRGGELIQISTTDPAQGITRETLPLRPTAAIPFLEGFLLGTTEGLMYWSERDRDHRVVALPLTRTPVLSLDRLNIPEKDHLGVSVEREYIILGLANGRLRVVPGDLLCDLAQGRPPVSSTRGSATALGSSILAVEALKPSRKAPSRRYVLAALRDHSLRLFHVDSIDNADAMIQQHWGALRQKIGATTDRQIAEALLASATTPADREAIRYFLLQVIHHRIDARDASSRDWLIGQIPTFLRQASTSLFRLVAVDIGKLVGNDVDAMLRISLSLLDALPRRHPEWRRLAEQHLKVLNDATLSLSPEDAARLMAWTRFALKYVVLGHTFSERKFALRTLIRTNYRSHKYLDALIYQALLHQRGHDLAWSAEVQGDIHRLHAMKSLTIAVTRTGTFCFFSASGRRLRVLTGGVESSSASIGVDAGHVLASTIVERGETTHLVVSWSSPFELKVREPSLCVFTIKHVVDRGASSSGGREYVTIQRSPVRLESAAQGRPAVTIHSLCALPFTSDVVLAGLDDPAYHFGVLKLRGDTGTLYLASRAGAPKQRRTEPSALASGKVPSRAIAASCLDDRGTLYLAAIGSEGGDVSFVWFNIALHVTGFETVPFRYPVNSIELSQADGASKATANTRDCYVGTASGETFAGSIPTTLGKVVPIWRETYDSSVIAVRLWRTPLYEDGDGKREVVVTATENGRVCFHETRQASSSAPRLSETNNYSFRGLRLDQVNLPSALTYFTVVEGTTDFVAAGPGGKIFKGSFCFLRDSKDRLRRGTRDGFPENVWEMFEQIQSKMVRYDHLFFPGNSANHDQLELEILGLVDVENGALRCYLLHRQLLGPESGAQGEELDALALRVWGQDREGIESNVQARLQDLRPENREDRERTKIVWKSLGKAFLDRNLAHILDEVERAPSAEALSDTLEPSHAAVGATIEIMKNQVLEAARNSSSTAGKVRSAVVKEMLRVQVFRHLALERGRPRPIRDALVETITSCLGDDDRLVRVEALRAVGVMLRNIGVLRKRLTAEADERFMEHLFRSDVGELLWLVSLLTENLKRYIDFSLGAADSVASYYLSAIVPIFLLFPESTLRLCDCITRGGVSTAALDILAGRLPGSAGEHVQALIAKFYLVPCLPENAARKKFLNDYKRSTLEHWLKVETRNHSPSEDRLSSSEDPSETLLSRRLIAIYDALARFWEIEHSGQFASLPSNVELESSPDPEVAETPSRGVEVNAQSPLVIAVRVCARLSDLARDLSSTRLVTTANETARTDEILALRSEIDGPKYEGLLQPVRSIAYDILNHWQGFYRVEILTEGSSIKGYVLGTFIGEGGNGRVYVAVPDQAAREPAAVKVFRHIYDPEGRKRQAFLLGARLNRDLSGAADTRGIVRVLEVVEKPHPLYIMQLYDYDLGKYAAKATELPPATRYRHAVCAAAQLSTGLAAAHAEDITHGDIKASNILVRHTGRDRYFELANFGMIDRKSNASNQRVYANLAWSSAVPRVKRPLLGGWLDAHALARVLYEVFLRPPLRPLAQGAGEDELLAACNHLRTITCPDVPELDGLIAALLTMLDGACVDAGEFLEAIPGNTIKLSSDPQYPPQPGAACFTQDELFGFCAIVIEARLTRDSLLHAIPSAIIAGLPDNLPPREQFLTDLNRLNRWLSSTVQHPMKVWLKNALFHTDAAIFTQALKRFPR